MNKTPFTYHTPFIQGNKQRVTVVGDINQQTKKMDFSVAVNSKKDIFCRRTGRKIAMTRLNSGCIVDSIDIPITVMDKQVSFFVDHAKKLAIDLLKQDVKVTKKTV